MSKEGEEQKRQPGGIFVTSGMKLGVTGIRFSFDENGASSFDAKFQVGLDMTDKWLSVSKRNTANAIDAGNKLDQIWPIGDNEAAIPFLESEFFHSIQAVCTSAFAIDAFYASVKDHFEIPQDLIETWNKNRTSRVSRITETLRRAFKISDESCINLKKLIGEIFSLRDKAVHPSPEMSEPLYHPRLNVGMAWHFVWFREENARNCYSLTLSIICQLIRQPKPENKNLVDYCGNLITRTDSLLEAWESVNGKLIER